MNKKSDKAKLNVVVRTRITNEIAEMLQIEARREKIESSSLIRQIILEHYENTLSDTQIITNTMNQVKRKMNMLENKIEILGLLVLELTKAYSTTFPRKHLTEEISEKFYEEIITNLTNSMKNHKGKLESMILDIYELSGE